ncbi:MAG: hypothetical protein AAGI10_14445 [Pseudomonadota bacterium]
MFRVGNLTFESYPIAFFPDWRKVRQFDWRELEMGFTEVATYDCKPPRTMPNLPDWISLAPRIMTSARSPLGRQNKAARDARMGRMVAASQLGTVAKFVETVGKMFPRPNARARVPKADILSRIDKNYRHVIGYWRQDKFILLLPRGRNPHSDFLVLCLPDKVYWSIITVGICGTERLVESELSFLYPELEVFPTFEQSGPYKKIDPPRSIPGTKYRLGGPQFDTDVREGDKNKFWKDLERRDAKQRRRSQETGKPPGVDLGWLRDWPWGDVSLRHARHDAEMKRLSKRYGGTG